MKQHFLRLCVAFFSFAAGAAFAGSSASNYVTSPTSVAIENLSVKMLDMSKPEDQVKFAVRFVALIDMLAANEIKGSERGPAELYHVFLTQEITGFHIETMPGQWYETKHQLVANPWHSFFIMQALEKEGITKKSGSSAARSQYLRDFLTRRALIFAFADSTVLPFIGIDASYRSSILRRMVTALNSEHVSRLCPHIQRIVAAGIFVAEGQSSFEIFIKEHPVAPLNISASLPSAAGESKAAPAHEPVGGWVARARSPLSQLYPHLNDADAATPYELFDRILQLEADAALPSSVSAAAR
jgi:hypothetical protein